jgi:hypothetical protein
MGLRPTRARMKIQFLPPGQRKVGGGCLNPLFFRARQGEGAACRAYALQLLALLDLAKFSIAEGLRLFSPVDFVQLE